MKSFKTLGECYPTNGYCPTTPRLASLSTLISSMPFEDAKRSL